MQRLRKRRTEKEGKMERGENRKGKRRAWTGRGGNGVPFAQSHVRPTAHFVGKTRKCFSSRSNSDALHVAWPGLACRFVHVRYMSSSVRPSVCLSSVTFVHPNQATEIFGNVSTPCGTLAIHDLCMKILRRSSEGNPSVGGVKHKRGSRI